MPLLWCKERVGVKRVGIGRAVATALLDSAQIIKFTSEVEKGLNSSPRPFALCPGISFFPDICFLFVCLPPICLKSNEYSDWFCTFHHQFVLISVAF